MQWHHRKTTKPINEILRWLVAVLLGDCMLVGHTNFSGCHPQFSILNQGHPFCFGVMEPPLVKRCATEDAEKTQGTTFLLHEQTLARSTRRCAGNGHGPWCSVEIWSASSLVSNGEDIWTPPPKKSFWNLWVGISWGHKKWSNFSVRP